MISVCLCFHYKATYSALFIHGVANIIRHSRRKQEEGKSLARIGGKNGGICVRI